MAASASGMAAAAAWITARFHSSDLRQDTPSCSAATAVSINPANELTRVESPSSTPATPMAAGSRRLAREVTARRPRKPMA